jgi:hypothetical protein
LSKRVHDASTLMTPDRQHPSSRCELLGWERVPDA